MKPNKNPDRYELVASVTRYTGREDLIGWMRRFPTKYRSLQLKHILDDAKDAKFVLWSLDDVWSRKDRELFVEDGITVL